MFTVHNGHCVQKISQLSEHQAIQAVARIPPRNNHNRSLFSLLDLIDPSVVAFSRNRKNSKKFKFLLLWTMSSFITRKGSKEWHPFKEIVDRNKKLEVGEDFLMCCEFVSEICNKPCRDRMSGMSRTRKCCCLALLQDNTPRQEAVARYMAAFIS